MWILTACKIFVDQGKGSKDRYILFPQAFGLVLHAHLAAHPKNRFVFETQRWARTRYGACSKLCSAIGKLPGWVSVHPHLFRHQMLTFLTGQKLSDAQIQLLSGHASKKSLEIYQHLSLDAVEGAYQQAVKLLEM